MRARDRRAADPPLDIAVKLAGQRAAPVWPLTATTVAADRLD